MWVKDFHKSQTSLNINLEKDTKTILESSLLFLQLNIEIDETAEVFFELLRDKIWNAMLVYFPEMRQYTEEIKKEFDTIIDKRYKEIFWDALSVIYQFIDKPDKSDDGLRSYKSWQSDEELETTANEYALKAPEEIREYFRQSFLLSLKNGRHYKHFGDIVHVQILACTTDVFEDIPELSGNGIRYFDSVMWDKSIWLFDDLKNILAERIIDPYDENLPYKQMNK